MATPFDIIGSLFLAEYDDVVRTIRGRGLAADAEDVATEVFLELAELVANGKQSDDPAAMRASLYARAVHRAMDAHKRAGAVERLLADLKDVELARTPTRPVDDRLAVTLDETLYATPRRRAQAWILVILRGADVTEAAHILGLSRPTIYAWVDDVSGELRERIESA